MSPEMTMVVPVIIVLAVVAIISSITPSIYIASLIVAFVALISVFVAIPLISTYAFWFMLAAYFMCSEHWLRRKL